MIQSRLFIDISIAFAVEFANLVADIWKRGETSVTLTQAILQLNTSIAGNFKAGN